MDLALEEELRALCANGSHDQAAEIALRRAGPQLLRFLVHAHRDHDEACEVFSVLAEDVWRGLRAFRWECSFRTWAYCLARRASSRHRRRRRGEAVFVAIADLGPLSEIVAMVRTDTLTAIRSERRNALERLRDELDIDERMLLSLRVERELSWPEIAAVLGEGGDSPDAAAVARVRKRFQLLKDRMKRRGRELGLVPSEGHG